MAQNKFRTFSNLQQRLITGLLGTAVFIWALASGYWGYFSIGLFLCVACQLEFYRLLFQDGNAPLRTYGTAVGTGLYILSFFIEKGDLSSNWYFILFPQLALVYFIKLYRTDQKPFSNIGYTFLGILYTALPFSLLNVSAFSFGGYKWELVLGIFLLLWASDTGAYFAGVRFGRTKLFQRISPKKTWEGFVGGATLATIICFALVTWFTDISPWHWFAISTIIVIAGTYGDLVESLFKRSILIKDSGVALPGHGGFLDRFDGLLLSMPFIAALLKLLQ